MSTSAFGVDHGEISKGILRDAKLGFKAVKDTAKLRRLHDMKAMRDAGYPTTIRGNAKEAFKAGKNGRASAYTKGQKYARRAGKARTKADVEDIMAGRKPGRRFPDPGMVDQGMAGFNRSWSKSERFKIT